ncbi:uncharacterized protein LOC124158834 isoform X2 [Ischnura elegans]|uniref:uncharacterized protein LOC124158834 isoform X2 n=1 Tax=Ischnura elegans TaxID=197161 RepID=UPI001ED8A551|nr:uncharacterized protein LOC124158834 isoform X2 [Ischnura elegans]
MAHCKFSRCHKRFRPATRNMNANATKGGEARGRRRSGGLPPEDDGESAERESAAEEEAESAASASTPRLGGRHMINCSNNIRVHNSSDIHIGDRTYLNIHQTTTSNVDDLKQIISHVVESSSIQTVVNVKTTTEQSGCSSSVFVQGVSLVKEADVKGAQVDNPDSHASDSSRNKKRYECGPGKAVIFALVAVISVVTFAGLIFAAIHLTSDHRVKEYDSFEGTESQVVQAAKEDDHSEGSVNVSNGVPQPPKHHRGWTPVSRDLWGSWTSEASTPPLQHPVALVIVAHTAGQSCETVVTCRNKMKDLQDYSVGQMKRPDIPYNFLVGRDGNAYEGVGWDHQSIANKKYNNCSISISYIGNYVRVEATSEQLQATKNILSLGVKLKKLSPDYIVVSHNLTMNTMSPGISVFEQISGLPHFTNDDSFLPL